MTSTMILNDKDLFSRTLQEKMKPLAPVVQLMEPYEFRYSLNNITPTEGNWAQVEVEPMGVVEQRVSDLQFFEGIQIKPRVGNQIVLDENITRLTQMIFVGLVTGEYSPEWVTRLFYFDLRSFNFYVRSVYITDAVRKHLGGAPFKTFEPKQKAFDYAHEVGYRGFMDANSEVDQAFIDLVVDLIKTKGTPILIGIAGPTAAGKTEIVDRLNAAFARENQKITSIELDNFLLDRDYREENNIGSFGKRALHFDLLQQCIADLLNGKAVETPRYDFIDATSSHDLQGRRKPAGNPVHIEPADIIFIEGNSPFLLEELAPLVGIKVVYLTDDPVRLKRKWRRDIDYRKKYDPWYLRNRFFKEQPVMAVINYQPQLVVCDIFVDTTKAELWVNPEVQSLLTEVK